ncbi:hypothetical protein [uncultured Roseibium sp.]|uniref:hypothetical protein n=1 Tax=uncultured Roseibium sp. TaxID=1936171 RepID=UPI002625A423|nr:hypothetical protein [uncultured Roseibium sp.]
MKICGIDPGQKGGIAFIDTSAHRLYGLRTFEMPGFNVSLRGKKTGKKILDASEVAKIIRLEAPEVVVIEHVHAMPKQGVTSMFNFGKDFGTLIGVSHALGYKPVLYSAKVWKGGLGLNSSKELSLETARSLFPSNLDDFKRKKDDGRAEAALLAYYHWKSISSVSSQKQK